MSFILEALKKSETERQQQQSADFATVPRGGDSPAAPRWLWVLGLLLIVNLAVVSGLLLRPDAPANRAVSPPDAEAPEAAAVRDSGDGPPAADAQGTKAGPSFPERVADARRRLPSETAPPPPAGTVPDASSAAVAPAIDMTAPAPDAASEGVASLPSLEELQLKGRFDLPPLHIDLHVYNEAPDRRFVSINMNKYRENEKLREGPLVREITREGVVLEFDGTAFALLQ
jgi:general secretion pathway protein B